MKMKRILSVILSVILLCSCMIVSANAAGFMDLDLVFVIDSTNSMADSIDRLKADMSMYVEKLVKTRKDFRVAIVDYRDYADRSGSENDYPYNIALDFTDSPAEIFAGINTLGCGFGGDGPETICAALIDGLDALSWREDAAKAAILIGDANALDPEPHTGYTKEMVVNKLRYDSVGYGGKTSAASEVSAAKNARSHVQLFTIAVVSEFYREYEDYKEMMQLVYDDFAYLADGTGGEFYVAEETWDITEIILDIIENIDDLVVDPDEPIMTKNEKKIDGIWTAICTAVVAPYVLLYMAISKMIDSSSANFNRLLDVIERIFVK